MLCGPTNMRMIVFKYDKMPFTRSPSLDGRRLRKRSPHHQPGCALACANAASPCTSYSRGSSQIDCTGDCRKRAPACGAKWTSATPLEALWLRKPRVHQRMLDHSRSQHRSFQSVSEGSAWPQLLGPFSPEAAIRHCILSATTLDRGDPQDSSSKSKPDRCSVFTAHFLSCFREERSRH